MKTNDALILLPDEGMILVPYGEGFNLYVHNGKVLILRVKNIEYELYTSSVYDRVIDVRDYVLNEFLKRESIIDLKKF